MTRTRLMVLIAAAIAVLLVVLYAITRHTETAKPGTLAALAPVQKVTAVPDIVLVDSAGHKTNLAAYRGHFLLLNLWASWCPPCVRELPALARLQQAIPKAQFSVLTVDAEHNASTTAAEFLRSHAVTGLPDFTDGALKVSQALHVYGMPTTVLIDPQGREVARAVGPADWDAPESIAYFKALSSVGK